MLCGGDGFESQLIRVFFLLIVAAVSTANYLLINSCVQSLDLLQSFSPLVSCASEYFSVLGEYSK